MNRTTLILTGVLTLFSSSAKAANFTAITSPPTILNLVIFIGALACVVFGLKIVDLVRGGQLSKVWQLFIAAFVLLVLSEAALLCGTFEFFSLPEFVVPALMTLAIGLFLYGVTETRKVLS